MLSTVKFTDFWPLGGSWNELHQRSQSPNVFTRFEWQTTWWQHFGAGADLSIWTLWEDEELVGVAPLMKQNGCLSLVGGRAVSDFLDFFAAPGYETQLATAVIDKLRAEQWQAITLRGLRRDSPFLPILPAVIGEAGWAANTEVEDVSPGVALPRDWETYVASMSKKNRHELRRKMRRLHDNTSWNWYVFSGQPVASADMDDFIRLLRMSSPDKARFMDERMERFFHVALGALIGAGLGRLYFLEIDGRRVSSTVCFDQGEELWLYNSGFDPAYSAWSAGLILKALCLRDAIELGKKRFDFLRGDEPYKYHLGAIDEPVCSLRVQRSPGSSGPLPRFADEH